MTSAGATRERRAGLGLIPAYPREDQEFVWRAWRFNRVLYLNSSKSLWASASVAYRRPRLQSEAKANLPINPAESTRQSQAQKQIILPLISSQFALHFQHGVSNPRYLAKRFPADSSLQTSQVNQTSSNPECNPS